MRADDLEHRAEDLVAVALHLGRDVVEQRDAEEEALRLVVEDVLASIGAQRGALRHAAVSRYEATLSRCSFVMSGPISEPSSFPGPTLIFGSRSSIAATSGSATSPTATTTLIAMQRSPAEP